jgi:phytoene dehydrogenase-like protein
MGMWSYVEQNFGAWTVAGGLGSLAGALASRLATRGVTVLTSTPVLDLELAGGLAVGVRTQQGVIDADHVVCAVDPRRLPALAAYVDRTVPARPPAVCHLGLEGDVPDLPAEVVLHGDPLLVLRTGGAAPHCAHAWTVLRRGSLAEDPVAALSRAGIAVGELVRTRLDRSPDDLMRAWGGSPYGVLWQGRSTVTRRLGPRTPVANVLAAGAHATPGAGLPAVGLSAALVAQVLGPA